MPPRWYTLTMRGIAATLTAALLCGLVTIGQAFLISATVAMVHIGAINMFLNRPGS